MVSLSIQVSTLSKGGFCLMDCEDHGSIAKFILITEDSDKDLF